MRAFNEGEDFHSETAARVFGVPVSEVTYLFAALDLTEGEMQPDEDEFVEVVRLPIAEVEKMIERDEIRDAKTVAAMYRAKLKNLY